MVGKVNTKTERVKERRDGYARYVSEIARHDDSQ
jgi:hypothetical protein